MKLSSLILPASAGLLMTAAVLSTAGIAQAPQGAPPPGTRGPGGQNGGQRPAPPPTNLKVLPKDLTGDQVRNIMRTWKGETGMDCEECHATDPTKIGQNGKPQTDFPSDKKPEKEMARIMFTMTEDMKHNYIPKVAALDTMTENTSDLTCGTCHRGKKDPEEFVIPKENRQGQQGGPQGAPPAGAPMPMGR